ncbi:hypothetical protein GCM10011321_26300 [Youhaiella tibetensis]|nr:hypothetical protein GCM10011321_26300 [Youhaiella tibetensis]
MLFAEQCGYEVGGDFNPLTIHSDAPSLFQMTAKQSDLIMFPDALACDGRVSLPEAPRENAR